jgi:hypothetical protein
MSQGELIINTSSGKMRAKDVPDVIAESTISQNVKMAFTLGVFAIISIMFIATLNTQDYNRFFNVDIKTSNLPVSYSDDEKYMKKFVMGSKIQIHSPIDNLVIEYIIPHFSNQFLIDKTKSTNGLNPILGITQNEGNGSLYEINLVNDQPISMVAIMGSDNEEEYKKLDTAKVVIRNEEGKKVWTSCSFLKPTQFNYIRVVKD